MHLFHQIFLSNFLGSQKLYLNSLGLWKWLEAKRKENVYKNYNKCEYNKINYMSATKKIIIVVDNRVEPPIIDSPQLP